jgi:hypothetical protein
VIIASPDGLHREHPITALATCLAAARARREAARAHVDRRERPRFFAIDGSRAHADGARLGHTALGTHGIDLAAAASPTPCAGRQCGIDRAAEISLRFANGTLAHISVSGVRRQGPVPASAPRVRGVVKAACRAPRGSCANTTPDAERP